MIIDTKSIYQRIPENVELYCRKDEVKINNDLTLDMKKTSTYRKVPLISSHHHIWRNVLLILNYNTICDFFSI